MITFTVYRLFTIILTVNRELVESQKDISGVSTFFLNGGKGEPIIFLHGVPSFSFLWRKVMSKLIDNFAVYAPDLPGYARSEAPADYSLDGYSKWLLEFCNYCSNKKINLVVHDAGGPISLAFALKHQERVKRLVVMNTIVSYHRGIFH